MLHYYLVNSVILLATVKYSYGSEDRSSSSSPLCQDFFYVEVLIPLRSLIICFYTNNIPIASESIVLCLSDLNVITAASLFDVYWRSDANMAQINWDFTAEVCRAVMEYLSLIGYTAERLWWYIFVCYIRWYAPFLLHSEQLDSYVQNGAFEHWQTQKALGDRRKWQLHKFIPWSWNSSV